MFPSIGTGALPPSSYVGLYEGSIFTSAAAIAYHEAINDKKLAKLYENTKYYCVYGEGSNNVNVIFFDDYYESIGENDIKFWLSSDHHIFLSSYMEGYTYDTLTGTGSFMLTPSEAICHRLKYNGNQTYVYATNANFNINGVKYFEEKYIPKECLEAPVKPSESFWADPIDTSTGSHVIDLKVLNVAGATDIPFNMSVCIHMKTVYLKKNKTLAVMFRNLNTMASEELQKQYCRITASSAIPMTQMVM